MANAKYIIFSLTILFGVPIGTSLAEKNKKIEDFVFFLMIFFTVVTITINFVSMENYRGIARGFEIGLVDMAMLIIIQLVKKRKQEYPITKFPPGSKIYFVFFIFCWISIINSDPSWVILSYFEIWKMVRMYFYFWAIYNYVNNWEKIDLLMRIVGLIVIYVAMIVLKQKYVEGQFQCPGPFPHQNSLVMYMIVFNSLVFAYLLNRKDVKIWYWLLVFALGSMSIVSTLSRAGMAFYVIACATVWFFSFTQGFTGKKFGITFLLVLVGVIGLLQAMDSIVERFETAPEESAMTRVVLAQTAVKMANDKVFGIGINNFGLKVNPPYTYGEDIYAYMNKGESPPEDYEENWNLVETAYLSYAAETGWHNLGVYLFFLLFFYFMNVKNFFKLRGSEYQFFAIGLMGGLLGIYLESTLEWVLRQTNNYYQLMMMFAFIGAMRKIYLKEEQEKNARPEIS